MFFLYQDAYWPVLWPQARFQGNDLIGVRRTLAELHGDLFSHHASPLEVYVFVAVANRGEHVMSGEICRRCNGKQQGRRRGGRSVQLSDSFMILHSSSRHSCTYTYVLYVRPNIFSGKKRKPLRRSGLGDGHVLVQKSRAYQKKRKTIPGTYVFRTETRGDYFLTFWWPAVGEDTFSPLAQILSPV